MPYRYAEVTDMIERFGEGEMVRLSVADGEIPDDIVPARIEAALMSATDLVDSYLRNRYSVPLLPAPASIVEATCVIARCALSSGGDRNPSEQMIKNREATIAWLKGIASSLISIDTATPVAPPAGARSTDRDRIFPSNSVDGF